MGSPGASTSRCADAAISEFYHKYYDSRGYVQCVLRWGADDGPDDAFENMAGWPELHALGGDDEVLRLYTQGLDGMLRQYTEAKTTQVPAGRNGMYYREFSTQSDWMHHGEALRVFNRMGLSVPTDAKYRARARRYAAMYMGEDSDAPNYDPKLKLIRSPSLVAGVQCCARPLHWTGSVIRSISKTLPQDTANATSTRCLRITRNTATSPATPS